MAAPRAVRRALRHGLTKAEALEDAFIVSGLYGLVGPPLGACVVVGPVLALFGYVALGPALFVGLMHGALLATPAPRWLRLLVVPIAGLAATALFLHGIPKADIHAWMDGLTRDLGLIVGVALLPTTVCLGLAERIHQRRKRARGVRLEPLRLAHLDELADVLLHPAVYQHIGGTVPSMADFKRDLQVAIEGPPPGSANEVWLNWLVRDEAGMRVLGHVQAVAHDGLVEIALRLRPDYWGQGLAQDALARTHILLEGRFDPLEVWATTTPANRRCQALLERCGYVSTTGPLPRLFSYEEGDLVYVRSSGRRRLPDPPV